MQILTREARNGPEKVASDTGSVNLTLVTPVATTKHLALHRAAEARRRRTSTTARLGDQEISTTTVSFGMEK